MTWLRRMLIAIDQLLNTLAGGNPDETISSRIGRASLRGEWLARRVLAPAIDLFFRLATGERDHCFHSIEWDELS